MENTRKMSSKIQNIIKIIRKYIGPFFQRLGSLLDRHPLTSFFGILALIVIVIIIGSILRKPQSSTEEMKKEPKRVEVFSIGSAPKLTFSGKIDKTGTVKIIAQSPGIVQYINTTEGNNIYKGQNILSLSSNYQGGNIASIGRQIAQQNADLAEKSYPDQLALIARQKEIAEQSDTNADQLRTITTSSIQATQDLISLNQEIVNSLDQQIEALQAANADGANNSVILQAKQGKSGVQSGLMSLKTALASQQYQQTSGNPPEKLSDLGKDIALGQLNLQEKSLNLSKEISQLNLKIAQINESFMYPAAFCNGTVERIHVTLGQQVNPGTVLATMSCKTNVTNVVVSVSGDIARQINRLEKSKLISGSTIVELSPRFISSEPTEGSLYAVIFTIPQEQEFVAGDGSSIKVEMPIGNAKSSSSVPYVPLDAVFQTQTASTIFIATKSAEGIFMVEGRDITLGNVFGSFVEVMKGLSSSDQVILDRTVIAGDEVAF